MTALFGDEPIILAGTTRPDRRYVQFWGLTSTAGIKRLGCVVDMADGQSFMITPDCPPEWRPQATTVFLDFMAGQMPRPTHTVTWKFGDPTFTPTTT